MPYVDAPGENQAHGELNIELLHHLRRPHPA
jgi:hypothetical protein